MSHFISSSTAAGEAPIPMVIIKLKNSRELLIPASQKDCNKYRHTPVILGFHAWVKIISAGMRLNFSKVGESLVKYRRKR
jgi:hypothetical protein